MSKKRKKKKIIQTKLSNTYDLSKPHDYFKSSFGMGGNDVKTYILNISVGSLLSDFKVFEDLNNVQSWPISTLIQRELDHKRASQIAKDYLLKDTDTKYFPPLIAVLIPTDSEYKPLESYPETVEDGLEHVSIKYIKGEERYEEYDELHALCGGIYTIPYGDEQGDIVWDKFAVSAVIIDGQHRYKALQEARDIDRDFDNCMLTVTVVDLVDICEDNKKTPTEVARDLFVTINNTPIEVDETRLVLMDDKDVLSTFTQVLIDDSDDGYEPAILPELVDWECEGAKHNSENSLSGVLVLRQIILSSIFDGSKVSTVEDRCDVKNIKKWKKNIDDWMSPDDDIRKNVGNEETIQHRFEIAEQDAGDGNDDDDEDSMFLFSYCTLAAKQIKLTFKNKLLPSFRYMFKNLEPYSRLFSVANDHGVLTNENDINNYYRSFKGKRDGLLKSPSELKKSVDTYEKEFKSITKNMIPYTVMGQKSIFRALFRGFLSGCENKDSEGYLERTEGFVEIFNTAYTKLCLSENIDEDFFSTEYRMRKNKTKKAGSIGVRFWKGIILKSNDEIDYSKNAVNILSQIIQDIVFYIDSQSEDNRVKDFCFQDRGKLISRHKRLIDKLEHEDELTNEQTQELAEKVVLSKEKELNRLLNSN